MPKTERMNMKTPIENYSGSQDQPDPTRRSYTLRDELVREWLATIYPRPRRKGGRVARQLRNLVPALGQWLRRLCRQAAYRNGGGQIRSTALIGTATTLNK